MSFDASEFRDLAYDLGEVPAKLIGKVTPVVSKGALNIKQQIQRDFRRSTHFAGTNPNVSYTVEGESGGITAEIAPFLEDEGFGDLVGIAIHGASRGGGGTVPDPIVALRAEEPRFVENIAQLTGYVFDE